MKTLLFLIAIVSTHSWGISPGEFNQTLMEGVREDIKQDRYLQSEKTPGPSRGPASIQRDEEFERKEYLRKNKVNGLHEKW